MIRVLFVDDEAKILDGMRRSLHRMRNVWSMEFVSSGAAALASLESCPADVIVSDMRMPGMDGWQLLAVVKERYPQTVRFILSGHADPESIMRAVGTAHQYLSKPCDSPSLTKAVTQTQMLRELLTDRRFERLVGQIGMLPTAPAAFQELLQCLQHPKSSAADAARIISRDVSMTANIMKLVNSAFFGARQAINSPDRAVAYLGLDTLGALVLGHSVFDTQGRAGGAGGLNMERLWGHSLETAKIARQIALQEKWTAQKAEEAFLAGVLHDVGKIVLATQAVVVPESSDPPADPESVLHHAEVGAYLLSLWGFPSSIVEAVAFHHNPGRLESETLDLAGLLHIADQIAHEIGGQGGDDPGLEKDYLEKIGLADRWIHWMAGAKPSADAQAAL